MLRTGKTVVRSRGAMDWDKQSRVIFRISIGGANVNQKGGNIHQSK